MVCPGHTAGRRLAWDWDDSLDDSKTCFLPGDFSVCLASSTLLTGKIKNRPQCRAQTCRAARPCPACLPAPALPRISSPLCPTFLGGIAQGGSLTLTRPLDQAGAALPEVTEHAQGLCPTQAQCPPDCPARVEAAFPASARMQGPRLEPHCVQMPRRGQGTGLTSPPTRHSTSVAKYLEREKKPNQMHICRTRPVGFLPETCGPPFSHVPLTCSSDLTKRRPLGRAGAWPVARGQCPPSVPPGWAVRAPVGTTPHPAPMAPSLQGLAKTEYLLCLPGTYDPKGCQRRDCRWWGRAPWSEHPHRQRVSQAGMLTKRERQPARVAPTVHTTKEGTEAKPKEGTGWAE